MTLTTIVSGENEDLKPKSRYIRQIALGSRALTSN